LSILAGELAQEIADALAEADIPLTAIVTRMELDPASPPWAPTYTAVPYNCTGLVDAYSAIDRVNAAILITDVRLLIVAATLAVVPAVGNFVTINSTIYTVVSVRTDPATALWELQARV
jgi:hypothetical protein